MAYDWSKYDGHRGWRTLIDPLIEECKAKGVIISQIKEKFGGLRFYVCQCDSELDVKIQDAERKSFTMCEDCGAPAHTREVNGWLYTMCDAHLPPSI